MEVDAPELYPPVEPWAVERLAVGDGHELHVEQAGDPDGKPVVFLHGGPGGGAGADDRRWFDPAAYRIVVFDQRGSGRSTPGGSLEANTTWHLVSDLERIREHLEIDRWQVFGGSWGSTLALAYAESYRERVSELIVRGIFLGRRWETEWFYEQGANMVFPDLYEPFSAVVPQEPRDSGVINRCYARLAAHPGPERDLLAREWVWWERRSRHLVPHDEVEADLASDQAMRLARIEAHYFAHGCFLDPPEQLLRDARRIADIPGVIVQGRYDLVCPFRSAWDLHRAWPEARFVVIPDAGHAYDEPGITSALVDATNRFRDR